MAISNDLLTRFARASNQNDSNDKAETYAYGNVVIENDILFVILDGAGIKTPVNTMVEVNSTDRVMVMIKNHSATIIGNISDPASSNVTKQALSSMGTKEPELEDELFAFSPNGKYSLKIEAIKKLLETSQDYNDLLNKPSIEGAELVGDKTYGELNLNSISNSELEEMLTI